MYSKKFIIMLFQCFRHSGKTRKGSIIDLKTLQNSCKLPVCCKRNFIPIYNKLIVKMVKLMIF